MSGRVRRGRTLPFAPGTLCLTFSPLPSTAIALPLFSPAAKMASPTPAIAIWAPLADAPIARQVLTNERTRYWRAGRGKRDSPIVSAILWLLGDGERMALGVAGGPRQRWVSWYTGRADSACGPGAAECPGTGRARLCLQRLETGRAGSVAGCPGQPERGALCLAFGVRAVRRAPRCRERY